VTNRLLFLVVLGCALFCAGAAWLTTRLFPTTPTPETGDGPQAAKPAVPDAGKPPEAKPRPKPSFEIRRRVSRKWLDTFEITYEGGYLDAWLDVEIYGVRDELSLTMGDLRESHRWSRPAHGESASDRRGSATIVMLHRWGSYERRAVPECLIDARSSHGGKVIEHPMPFHAWMNEVWGEGGVPFNPRRHGETEDDPDGTTFVALWRFTYSDAAALGWPHYPEYWGDRRSADPELWDDRERKLGVPAARAAAAMVGLGGPFGSPFAAVPVSPTYRDLYLYGSHIQLKYRFLTEREVGLLRANAGRGDNEIERMIRGFRRTPNRVEVPAGK
jgi:hypothetical protein